MIKYFFSLLLWGTIVLVYVYAAGHHPGFDDIQASTSKEDKIFDIIIENGILGVILLGLSAYIWQQGKQNRTDRENYMIRIFDIIEKSNAATADLSVEVKEMHAEFREKFADHGARLQNIERDVDRTRGLA